LDMEYDLYCVLRSNPDLTDWKLKRVIGRSRKTRWD
jgi:hypothetical protein